MPRCQIFGRWDQSAFQLAAVYMTIAMIISTRAMASDDGAVIRGKIVQAGEPVPNIRVVLEDEVGQQYAPVFTDRAGMFVITGVKTGKYKIIIRQDDQSKAIQIAATGDLTNVPPIELDRGIEIPQVSLTSSPTSAPGASITNEEARAFVRKHMAATEEGDLSAVMATYAPQVDYYNEGVRNLDYIRKSQRKYFERYARRSFELGAIDVIRGDVPGSVEEDPHLVRVRFSFRYTVSGAGAQEKRGVGSELWILRKDDNQLHIVDCKENVIRE